MVGQAGQGWDCQGALNERAIGISEAALRNCFNRSFEIPNILGSQEYKYTELLEEFLRQGDAVTAKIFEMTHPSFGILKVQKLSNNVALPKRSTDGAAGYNLCASQDCTIPAGGKGLVKTGLSISFPTDLYAKIAPRSGLALKRFIDVGAGVADIDYCGEVGVVLFNHGDQDFEVNMGDRITQLILEKIDTPPVEEVQGLEDTVRGSSGFGNTGVKSGNDTGQSSEKKNEIRKNERTGEKNESEDKNETLKGRNSSGRMRTVKKTKIEGSSRLSREHQIISVK